MLANPLQQPFVDPPSSFMRSFVTLLPKWNANVALLRFDVGLIEIGRQPQQLIHMVQLKYLSRVGEQVLLYSLKLLHFLAAEQSVGL